MKMITKPVSKMFPRFIRNIIRAHRFYKYGWVCLGRAFHTRDDVQEFWVRRSNRVYNFVRFGIFSSVKINA
jgi:hypothetical protein